MVRLDNETSNVLIGMCGDYWENECWLEESPLEITQDLIKETEEEYEEDLVELHPLVGYMFTVKQKGKHKHDGQLVEYIFTFISPWGKKTKVGTEMCLMMGWNFLGEVEIE